MNSKKSSTSPAPLEKLNKIRDGIAKKRSWQRTGKTSFTLIKGKPSVKPKIPSLLKLDNKTRTSSSPSTDIVRSTTPNAKTRFVISPKPNERPKSRSIFSPTDDEVNNINNSRILSNHSVAHNSDLSKKSPPIIRKNSLEDDNSEAFSNTPVGKEHLRKSARHFDDDDDGHLTPLNQYPMGSSRPNEGDNLFEDLFNFSRDDQYKIEGPFTEEISDIDHQLFELQQRENKLLKRKLELQKRNKKNPCRSTKMAKTRGRGRGRNRGRGRGGSRGRGRRKSGNMLMNVMNQLKF